MNIKKFFMSIAVTVLVFVTVAGGVALARFLFGTSLSDEITSLLDKPVDKLNFLLLGTDEGGMRADVIMLVSVDPKEPSVKIISIPRDTRVDTTGNGKFDKINHTLGYKEPEKTIINAVKRITGMPINYYAQIDFEGFRNIIDILGGVDFDLPINMNYDDPAQNLHIHLNKGYQHFDGKMAEGVVRFRNTYANGDEGRIAMQQEFLKAIFEQKLSPQYIARAPQIINEVYENVKTNFAVSDALKYISTIKKLSVDSLSTFKLPGYPKYMNKVSYYIYNEEEVKNLVLYEFGYPEDKAAELARMATATPEPSSEN